MKTQMSLEEASRVLARNGYMAYMGPGHGTSRAILDFMARYPRGQGIKGHQTNLLVLYEACYVVNRERSRTRDFLPVSG